MLNAGHGFPFGRLGPLQGWCARARQSSADDGNDDFRLTKARVFGEDDDANQVIFPGPAGHAARPKGGLSCF